MPYPDAVDLDVVRAAEGRIMSSLKAKILAFTRVDGVEIVLNWAVLNLSWAIRKTTVIQ